MNRIVREHYPVAELPDDLKELMPGAQHVRLVIEPIDEEHQQDVSMNPALTQPDRVMSLDELFAMRRPPYRTTVEIVAEIRQQRDEWDD